MNGLPVKITLGAETQLSPFQFYQLLTAARHLRKSLKQEFPA